MSMHEFREGRRYTREEVEEIKEQVRNERLPQLPSEPIFDFSPSKVFDSVNITKGGAKINISMQMSSIFSVVRQLDTKDREHLIKYIDSLGC